MSSKALFWGGVSFTTMNLSAMLALPKITYTFPGRIGTAELEFTFVNGIIKGSAPRPVLTIDFL